MRRASRESATRSAKTARYVEAGENDNLIVQKLEANPKALGIFGYSFLEENVSQLQGALDRWRRARPSRTSPRRKYPVSRPLFVYVKKAHIGVIPGLQRVRHRVRQRSLDGRRGLSRRQGPGADARRRAAPRCAPACSGSKQVSQCCPQSISIRPKVEKCPSESPLVVALTDRCRGHAAGSRRRGQRS